MSHPAIRFYLHFQFTTFLQIYMVLNSIERCQHRHIFVSVRNLIFNVIWSFFKIYVRWIEVKCVVSFIYVNGSVSYHCLNILFIKHLYFWVLFSIYTGIILIWYFRFAVYVESIKISIAISSLDTGDDAQSSRNTASKFFQEELTIIIWWKWYYTCKNVYYNWHLFKKKYSKHTCIMFTHKGNFGGIIYVWQKDILNF